MLPSPGRKTRGEAQSSPGFSAMKANPVYATSSSSVGTAAFVSTELEAKSLFSHGWATIRLLLPILENTSMEKKDFLSHIGSLSIDRHILGGKRGAEENVKLKLIVPLLQCLGWDLLGDMHFENVGADIVLFSEQKPSMIVETKSWGEVITDHLNQCLEYCFKLKTPWVIVSTGRDTALYCALLNPDNLAVTEPSSVPMLIE